MMAIKLTNKCSLCFVIESVVQPFIVGIVMRVVNGRWCITKSAEK